MNSDHRELLGSIKYFAEQIKQECSRLQSLGPLPVGWNAAELEGHLRKCEESAETLTEELREIQMVNSYPE